MQRTFMFYADRPDGMFGMVTALFVEP